MDFFVLNFQVFLLVLVRVFGMFVVAPFFSSDVIPVRMRVIAAVYITACVFPMTANYVGPVPENMFSYAMLVVSEAMIGILIGFMMAIIFSAFQLAATFFSFQMALGIAEVIDPLSEIGVTVVGQLWTLMGIMVFIAIDGPQMLVMGTVESFRTARIFSLVDQGKTVTKAMVDALGSMFIVALKLSFPILITLFLLAVTLGLLAKAAPQMNIFMLGFPIQIGVGFLIMIVVMGAIAFGMAAALTRAFDGVVMLLRAMGR
jgi:flagellar biosynthetic protein FliR